MNPVAVKTAPVAATFGSILFALLVCAGLPMSSHADRVFLTNGSMIEGVVLSRGSGQVVVQTDAGEIVVPERDVVRIQDAPYSTSPWRRVTVCGNVGSSPGTAAYSTKGSGVALPAAGTPAHYGLIAGMMAGGFLARTLIVIPVLWLAAFLVGARPSTLSRAARTYGWEIAALLFLALAAAAVSVALPALADAGFEIAAGVIGVLFALVGVVGSLGLYLGGIRRVHEIGLGHALGFAIVRVICECVVSMAAFLALGLAVQLAGLGAR